MARAVGSVQRRVGLVMGGKKAEQREAQGTRAATAVEAARRGEVAGGGRRRGGDRAGGSLRDGGADGRAAAGEDRRYSAAKGAVVFEDGKAVDWCEPGSAIARGKDQDQRNAFVEPSAKNFSVRGPNYLQDRKKQPSRSAVFRPIGVQT